MIFFCLVRKSQTILKFKRFTDLDFLKYYCDRNMFLSYQLNEGKKHSMLYFQKLDL